ncbi:hypothetical protein KR200_008682 [Drosophila serrata]|nr:hypothetical protein KR200_008682 [Drosophila serrata]
MASQLLSLGLTLALIFLIGGHWTDARPQNPYYVENGGHGGFGGPETHHHRSHHGHGHGHGHGHEHGFGPGHGHGFGPDFSGGYPSQPQSPNFGPPPTYPVNQYPGGPFSGQQPGGGRFGNRQPGNFVGGQQPGPNIRPQPGQGGDFMRGQPGFQQPGGDFNRGQSGGGDFNGRRQPGFQQPGTGPNRGQPGFQQPGTGPNRGQPGLQQPGTGPNRGQPGFQQPEGDFNARQPDSNELPTYSRPGHSPGGFQQQPGSGENTLQPRPGSGQSPIGGVGGGFQQPGRQPGSSSNPLQPRPGNNNEDDYSQFNFQTPNTLQPRPGQGPGQSPVGGGGSGFQQPGRQSGSSSNPLQPRPGNNDEDDFSQFNFQTPNTLQPRPGQDQAGGGASSVIQPIPGQTSTRDNVDKNLGDLFNTQEYLSPELSQGVGSRSGSDRDPKSETEEALPESVNQRNLFNTDPICTNGTERMAGRCRKQA